MAQPVEGTDDEVKLQELRREFLNFFHVVINNDLGRVFVSDGMPFKLVILRIMEANFCTWTVNLAIFDQIVHAIDHFARDNKDPQTQKLSFGLMSRMCTVSITSWT